MNRPPRIILVGFMGAGKTTVALTLAHLLADSAVSLDQSIAEAEGRSPRALIDEEGEDYFRAAETRALRRALEGGSARVVDAGGGAWTVEVNRDLAARHNCLAVWLDAPFELCWSRIAGETAAGERPLARDRQRARELYEARRALYALAPARVEVREGTSAEEVAAEIKMLAEQFAHGALGGRLKEEG
jgi:shikimate kinase